MLVMSKKPFSKLEASAKTIEFEREELAIYKSLVESNPKDEALRRACGIIARQVAKHERELNSLFNLEGDSNFYIIKKVIFDIRYNYINSSGRKFCFHSPARLDRKGDTRMSMIIPLGIKRLVRKKQNEISINDVKKLIKYHSGLIKKYPDNNLYKENKLLLLKCINSS